MIAGIITIGDELLNGQTVDTNSSWMGLELNKIGISVKVKISVGDTKSEIIDALDFLYKHVDLILVTGGLGPTHDDITKVALCSYFKDEMVFSKSVFKSITEYFNKTGRQPTAAHREQSFMPSKAVLLKNDRGTAPGMWFSNKNKSLLSMPGVPYEMKAIMTNGGLEKIKNLNPDQHIRHIVIQTAGLGETYIAQNIESIITALPSNITLAFLPGMGSVKIRLTATGSEEISLEQEITGYGAEIAKILGNAVVCIGESNLQEEIGRLALLNGVTIGTAESCTGGTIAQMITSVPGASEYFKGSIIAYSNEVKRKNLNVPSEILNRHGAVSEPTVKAMVQGAIKELNIDIAVAVSGVAGPGGGSPQKPVGTIWIAVGNKNECITRKLQLVKNRELNIGYTAIAALNELRLFLRKGQKI